MSRKNNLSNQKITALYCRISLDDGSQNESMSISNQKLMLKDYAEKNGMPRYEYYVDEGITGSKNKIYCRKVIEFEIKTFQKLSLFVKLRK